MRLFFLIWMLCCLLPGLRAQDDIFLHVYRAPGMDQAAKLIEREGGGFVLLGTTTSASELDTDFYIVLLDANLEIEFSTNLGIEFAVDRAVDLLELDNGNLVILGTTNSGGYNALLCEWDPITRELIWMEIIGNEGWDIPAAMDQDGDGNFWIVGESFGLNGQAWLCKVSETGQLLNQWNFGFSGNDRFTAIALDSEGDLFLSGVLESAQDSKQMWALRCTNEGALIWEFLSESETAEAHDIAEIAGNWIARGFRETEEGGRTILDYGLSPDGDVLWNNDISFGGSDYFVDGYRMAGSSMLAVGQSNSFGAGLKDFYVWRQHESGYYESGTTAGGTEDDYAVNGIQASNGEVYVLGTTRSFGAFQDDLLLVHFPVSAINPNPIQQVIIHEDEFITAVVDEPLKSVSLLYPNPCHTSFRISASSTAPLAIRIYDAQGRMVLSSSARANDFVQVDAIQAGAYLVVWNELNQQDTQSSILLKQ